MDDQTGSRNESVPASKQEPTKGGFDRYGEEGTFCFSEKRAILLRNSFLSLKQGSLTAK